jgi:Ca2+-binding RTX toxin-like protein
MNRSASTQRSSLGRRRVSTERGARIYHTRWVSIVVGSTVALVALFLAPRQVANAARPTCFGKPANIVGTARADVLKGTAKPDVIAGLRGSDVIKGLGGGDRICGGKGNDTLLGGGKGDAMEGDEGNDKVAGGAGFDFLGGGPGGDAVNGGTGIGDLAYFFGAPGPVTVDLTAGTATGDGSDTLTGVEDIAGSNFDDIIMGNAASNFLFGEAGNDTLSGGDGDDGLWGRGDDDALDGGSGDFVTFVFSQFGVTANLTSGTATGEGSDTLENIENIQGTKHDDTLTGDGGPNVFLPLVGNDGIDGSGGTDTVSYEVSPSAVTANLSTGTATGEGTDTLTAIENLNGSPLNDNLTGDAGPNVLHGLAGDDTLTGSDGDDT